jgi:starvation-inducible DNA-binding protein
MTKKSALAHKLSTNLSITDEIGVDIGLGINERTKVAEALSTMLASSYMLYVKTLNYHWNVTGLQFISLHELFDNQYNELNKSNDVLAERVRALGHFTPGTIREFLKLSVIQDDESLPDSSEIMVKNLLQAHETCSVLARKVLKVAQQAEDEVTVDMMINRMTYHDKTAWMLRSTLE